jgi:mRNA interferase RelE/StbE
LRTRFHWKDQARADLRRIDREEAMKILRALTDYANSGVGDVKRLQGSPDFRLRVGDYRVRFETPDEHTISILYVKHRSDAYR